MRKRLLSTLLALCLVLGMLPGTAWAKIETGCYTTFSVGSAHAAAIDENGNLWTWGKNYSGQLGNGAFGPYVEYDSLVPVNIMDNVKSVVCGNNYTAAIRTDNSLWMWGSNHFGELGNGSTESTGTPTKVMDDVSYICFGDNHTQNVAAIKTDGSLWTWGYNGLGNLGIGSDGNGTTETGVNYQTVPIKILDDVVSVSMGAASGCSAAIKSDGSLWMWGANLSGELVNGGDTPQTVPMKVMEDVSKVSLSGSNAAVVKTDGSLWVWGSNYHGQLGPDVTAYRSKDPVKVMDNVVDVEVGLNDWIVAVKADGSLWTWGRNEFGCLGDGTIVDSCVPIKIMDNVVSVSTNSSSTAAIQTDGSLWRWGLDYSGYEIGNGGISNGTSAAGQASQTVPVKIMSDVTAVSLNLSTQHAALKKDGTIWLWGQGILGNGSEDGSKVPVRIDLIVKQPSAIDSPSITPPITPAQTYPLSYNLMGGSGDVPVAENYTSGTQITITSTIPTRDGFIFDGWAFGPEVCQPGQTFIMPAQSVTLYARWIVPAPTNSTVSYDLNGGTGTIPFAQTYATGVTVTVTSSVPTKGAAEFLGWSDGSNLYQAGEAFIAPDHDVVLTAQWKAPIDDALRYAYQPKGSCTCTLMSAVMMLRGYAMNNGLEWKSITKEAVRVVAWTNQDTTPQKAGDGEWAEAWEFDGNMKCDFTFAGMHVIADTLPAETTDKQNVLINMLHEHPEGIVVYSNQHTVLLTRYDSNSGTFYCLDPAKYQDAREKPIPLKDSWAIGYSGDHVWDDSPAIGKIVQIWYINNASVIAPKSVNQTTISGNCPIEMNITVEGVTLSSQNLDGTISNNYMTVSASGTAQDRNISVIVPGDRQIGDGIDVEILGTDKGTMTFVTEYRYTDGTTETHTFKDVPLKQTTIATVSGFYPQSSLMMILKDTDITTSEKEIWVANPNEIVTEPKTDFVHSPNSDPFPDPSYPNISVPGGISNSNNTVALATYNITIPSVSNGKVTTTPASASKGTTVTLTATPDKGYELTSLTVTDSKGSELPLTDAGGGKYTFTMPDSKVSVSAVFQAVQTSQPPAEPTPPAEMPWSNPYTDVPEGEWYYEAVKFVSESGLMNGSGSNLFEPDANLSRAMLAQILYNKEGQPAVASTSAFTDVPVDEWYADAVTWAAAAGIVGGYGGGLFGPNDNITREQLAVMLWRYAGEPAATDKELRFSDADQVSSYALDALWWAVENGILNGKGDGILDPSGFATRAEVAQMLKNYLG